ncbi:MAG: RND transporter [Granulosicoccus sp.]
MLKLLDRLPLLPLVVISLTLGMAPFVPEPHLWEKLKMLATGNLTNTTDIFDLFMHGAAPALLVLKLLRMVSGKSDTDLAE